MLPERPLDERDLYMFGKKNLSNFRGVFMLDKLPAKPFRLECGVVNLDRSSGPGTHWVAYFKKKQTHTIF